MRELHSCEIERVIELTEKTKQIECFELDGSLFLGNRVELIKEYVLFNPSKTLYCWLVDRNDSYKLSYRKAINV